jgi:hypothetical protein
MRAPLPIGLAVVLTACTLSALPPAATASAACVAPEGDCATFTGHAVRVVLRLETLHGLLTPLYWGQPDAVELIEGCA